VISNYAELVLEDLPAGSPSSDDVREIRAAAERGARLTRQLLTFGRRHLRRPSEIDIGPMLRDSENLFRQLAGAHTEVLVDAGEGGIVHADPSEIDQILLNLVLNARDAMPTGGVLQVTCDVVSGDAAAIPGAPRSDACVRIVVSDTGSGIADDVLPHIFEPFFTTKGDRGTGLGLSTVHGIVTRNGGTVGVQTQPGVGTRFEVRLPRYGRPDDLATPGPTEAAAPAVSGTVLLVEDEVSLRNACRRVLERGGLRVIEARHGADGLRRWAEHGGAIDAVVTDLVMPEMGGRELAEALRRERPDLPVLFVSGYTDDPLARRAIEDPSVTFLAKPFAPADLLATVRGMLATAQS